ncbi:basic-leucine zipper transcription factor family protein [Striga asiatica]|uniref:Basic-leucine zipper transcription factor family protein n=1 Tax=Striga asiatica TaxID=4170 RepID=A0A5A7P177_STRAF|nr:basic-leucine zipper transcription factor family protein [Striga asiatica]
MSPVLSEILRSGFQIVSSLRRGTHLVQSLSVVFLYWFYVFSGNSSSGSPPVRNSGSYGDQQNLRKRKRMDSNRESARRSRQRKQRQLDDLTAQVARLRKDNGQISGSIDLTTQHCARVEAENSVLRARVAELTQRLRSLNEILNLMSSAGADGGGAAAGGCVFEAEGFPGQGFGDGLWSTVGFNQESKSSFASRNICYLVKKAESQWWSRLLKQEGKPPAFLKKLNMGGAGDFEDDIPDGDEDDESDTDDENKGDTDTANGGHEAAPATNTESKMKA